MELKILFLMPYSVTFSPFVTIIGLHKLPSDKRMHTSIFLNFLRKRVIDVSGKRNEKYNKKARLIVSPNNKLIYFKTLTVLNCMQNHSLEFIC